MPVYTMRTEGTSDPATLVEVTGVRYLEDTELTAEDPLLEVVWDHSDARVFDPPAWLEVDVEEQDGYGNWVSVTSSYRVTELKKSAETGAESDGGQVCALVELVP